jgi:hypothetical protein
MEAARLVETRQHSAAPLAPATDLEEGRSPPIAAAPPPNSARASLQPAPTLAPDCGPALPVLHEPLRPRQPPLAVNAGDEIDRFLHIAAPRGVPLSCLAGLLSAEGAGQLALFERPPQGLVWGWLAPQESAWRPVYT